jgi:hypothetical protein
MRSIRSLLITALFSTIAASNALALEISESVFKNYQEYLKTIGATRLGAFAVGPDGHGSYYVYCETTSCEALRAAPEALQGCAAQTGKTCILMAFGRQEKIEFTVVPARTKLSPEDDILANVLDAQRLKASIVGNTMQGEYPNQLKWKEYYLPDGTLRGKADQLGSFKGTYEFKGNSICYYYDGHSDWNWCAQISVDGNKIYFLENGELVSNERNTELLQGNPHGL